MRNKIFRMGCGFQRRNRVLQTVAFLLLSILAAQGRADWTHRYPQLESFRDQLYFEGYNLPVLNAGPTDPAPSPDGAQLAFAARGWLWLLDLSTGTARRITATGQMDSRPAWSPDGRRIAFVRDDTHDTSIVMLDLTERHEHVVVDDPGLEFDPSFSPDGKFLYYSSAAAGDLDLWRIDLSSGERSRLSDHPGAVFRPLALPDAQHVLYLVHHPELTEEIRLHRLADGNERVVYAGNIQSQSRPALSPDGRSVILNVPVGAASYDLRLFTLDEPHVAFTLAHGLPLTPAWSADGQTIYFTEADRQQRMVLKQVPYAGGPVQEVPIRKWEWGAELARLRIKSGPARIGVVDSAGHPLLPDSGQPRLDLVSGAVYFYSPDTIELTVPAGEIRVSAVRGLATPLRVVRQKVRRGETHTIELKLEAVWDARAAGYASGDHHFHLNYGGPYRLTPEDLLPQMQAEDLDVATPVLANLHNRLEDEQFWGWKGSGQPPLIRFGQEVRPHFFGHVGLIGTRTPFWPRFWGPYYEPYRWDDRTNAEALRHARREGGANIYVHPQPTPISLVPDVVLGEVDLYELTCLWSDSLISAEVWYRLLNLGIPIAPSAGTDIMANFSRIMAVGATRVYVRTAKPITFETYLEDLKAGRSFVTNGPLLDFRVADARPGDVLKTANGPVRWQLELHSASPVEKIEVLVNGAVVSRHTALAKAGSKSFSGSIQPPAGGWIAVRALGGDIAGWPGMDAYVFAHTAPIWFGSRGSTVPAVEKAAAAELLQTVISGQQRLHENYRGVPVPKLEAQFQKAREELERRQELPGG